MHYKESHLNKRKREDSYNSNKSSNINFTSGFQNSANHGEDFLPVSSALLENLDLNIPFTAKFNKLPKIGKKVRIGSGTSSKTHEPPKMLGHIRPKIFRKNLPYKPKSSNYPSRNKKQSESPATVQNIEKNENRSSDVYTNSPKVIKSENYNANQIKKRRKIKLSKKAKKSIDILGIGKEFRLKKSNSSEVSNNFKQGKKENNFGRQTPNFVVDINHISDDNNTETYEFSDEIFENEEHLKLAPNLDRPNSHYDLHNVKNSGILPSKDSFNNEKYEIFSQSIDTFGKRSEVEDEKKVSAKFGTNPNHHNTNESFRNSSKLSLKNSSHLDNTSFNVTFKNLRISAQDN